MKLSFDGVYLDAIELDAIRRPSSPGMTPVTKRFNGD